MIALPCMQPATVIVFSLHPRLLVEFQIKFSDILIVHFDGPWAQRSVKFCASASHPGTKRFNFGHWPKWLWHGDLKFDRSLAVEVYYKVISNTIFTRALDCRPYVCRWHAVDGTFEDQRRSKCCYKAMELKPSRFGAIREGSSWIQQRLSWSDLDQRRN